MSYPRERKILTPLIPPQELERLTEVKISNPADNEVLTYEAITSLWKNKPGGATWGKITGTLANQTDLQSALDGKQALDADLTAIAALGFTTTAFLKKTAANTWALDTNTYLTAESDPVAMAYLDQTVKTDSSPQFVKVKTPIIYPAVDSVTAVQINKADGITNVLNVDTTNSRVGIGTTGPGYKLDVAGNAAIYSGALTTTSLQLGTLANVGGQTSTANLVPDLITSPLKYDNTAGGNTLNKWVFYNNPGGAAYGIGMSAKNGFGLFSGDLGFVFSTGVTQIDGTGASQKMIIEKGGNVGIGTYPTELLTLGTSSGQANRQAIRINNDGYGDPGAWNTNSAGDKLIFWNNGIDADFRYGFNGTLWIKSMGSYNSNAFEIWGAYANSGSPVKRFVVQKDGNVGIGTITPTAVLHLKAGTATASTAPLKLTSGTLLTTLELGAIEFVDDGTTGHLYITQNVAGVLTRVQIV